MSLMTSFDSAARRMIVGRMKDAGDWSLRRRETASLSGETARNLFSHPAYLAAHGIKDVVQIDTRPPGWGSVVPRYFADRGSHLVHLGRLDRIDLDELHRVSARLLGNTGAAFVLFEDVEIQGQPGGLRLPSLHFGYQANWRLDIAGDAPVLSRAQARQIRAKSRKLESFAAQPVRFEFTRAKDDCIDRIVSFNRDKVRQAGRKHHLSDEKLRVLKSYCGEIGYQAALYSGDDLIAGDIICVTGGRAYMMVLGYDPTYEKFSPGQQVHSHAIGQLRALGCTEVNLLWGDSPWKSRIGADRHRLTTVAVAKSGKTMLSPDFWNACADYGIASAKDFAKRRILRR